MPVALKAANVPGCTIEGSTSMAALRSRVAMFSGIS